MKGKGGSPRPGGCWEGVGVPRSDPPRPLPLCPLPSFPSRSPLPAPSLPRLGNQNTASACGERIIIFKKRAKSGFLPFFPPSTLGFTAPPSPSPLPGGLP